MCNSEWLKFGNDTQRKREGERRWGTERLKFLVPCSVFFILFSIFLDVMNFYYIASEHRGVEVCTALNDKHWFFSALFFFSSFFCSVFFPFLSLLLLLLMLLFYNRTQPLYGRSFFSLLNFFFFAVFIFVNLQAFAIIIIITINSSIFDRLNKDRQRMPVTKTTTTISPTLPPVSTPALVIHCRPLFYRAPKRYFHRTSMRKISLKRQKLEKQQHKSTERERGGEENTYSHTLIITP